MCWSIGAASRTTGDDLPGRIVADSDPIVRSTPPRGGGDAPAHAHLIRTKWLKLVAHQSPRYKETDRVGLSGAGRSLIALRSGASSHYSTRRDPMMRPNKAGQDHLVAPSDQYREAVRV